MVSLKNFELCLWTVFYALMKFFSKLCGPAYFLSASEFSLILIICFAQPKNKQTTILIQYLS